MVFNDYAEFYDLYYNDKNYTAEIKFVLDLAARHGVNPHSVLDMGCGTGRHMEQFIKKGLSGDGFDLSEKMLAKAQKRMAGCNNVSFSQGNLLNFRNGKKYPLVVSLFAVMGYLTSNEDLISGLITAKEHLEDGGVFIFDGWFGPAALYQHPEERTHVYAVENGTVSRKAIPNVNAAEQIVTVDYEVSLENNGNLLKNFKESHRMRMMFVQEMKMAMRLAGLKMLSACPFMEAGKELSLDTWNVIFTAGKV